MAEVKQTKRLETELKQLITNPPQGIVVEMDKANPNLWIIHIKGPEKTAYEKGNFKVKCIIPVDYPFKAPELMFETKIYHPNIKLETGEICQEIYKKGWAPTKKIADIIGILISMLSAPNLEAPIEPEIAKEFTSNYPQFLKNCQNHIAKNAK